ncbi:MAG TPA: hypothetical protein VFZ02_08750 [Ktedonobacteraceae bacterium]
MLAKAFDPSCRLLLLPTPQHVDRSRDGNGHIGACRGQSGCPAMPASSFSLQ